MAAKIIQLGNKAKHDGVIHDCETTDTPTVIYVSNSALPTCKTFTPKYESLATEIEGVRFCQLDFSNETSMMFKFSPNQLPVVVLMRARWCRTLMSPSMKELRAGIENLMSQGDRLPN